MSTEDDAERVVAAQPIVGECDPNTDADAASGLPGEIARDLVRLIQCTQCSKPFANPLTLPCGGSLCRQCLPPTFQREYISYPAFLDRQSAIRCPFPDCMTEHPMADCSADVALSKVIDAVHVVMTDARSACGDLTTTAEEIPNPTKGTTDARPESDRQGEEEVLTEKAKQWTAPGGRLLSTFHIAQKGELLYYTDLTYQAPTRNSKECHLLDETMLTQLRDISYKELDCYVCYATMLDPVTTPCGHTFCRKCLARVLDHTNDCPMCRTPLFIPASLSRQASNQRINALLNTLCPDLLAARAEAVAADERGPSELSVPLFVCGLAFPTMTTFLHIFEPRYRLMIRRAMETTGQFGMIMYNRHGTPQGDLGTVDFMQYGTMLQILNVQMLPDGRSLIETKGVSRFRVKAHGRLDGYTVGDIERIEDVSLVEEEALEAHDLANQPIGSDDFDSSLNSLSTQQLLELSMAFTLKMQAASATWLRRGVIEFAGQPPNNPQSFPYWFATVLPINDDEKYRLLSSLSVRERLKITARWIHRIETSRWYMAHPCTVL